MPSRQKRTARRVPLKQMTPSTTSRSTRTRAAQHHAKASLHRQAKRTELRQRPSDVHAQIKAAFLLEDKTKTFEAISEIVERTSNPRAINNLAGLFLNGEGCERNIERAHALLEQASDLGCEWATFNLANMFRKGNTKPKDLSKSVSLLRKAFEQSERTKNDFLRAQTARLMGNIIEERHDPAFVTVYECQKEAYRLFTIAHELGLPLGTAELARCTFGGVGCTKSTTRAMALYDEVLKSDNAHANCISGVSLRLYGMHAVAIQFLVRAICLYGDQDAVVRKIFELIGKSVKAARTDGSISAIPHLMTWFKERALEDSRVSSSAMHAWLYSQNDSLGTDMVSLDISMDSLREAARVVEEHETTRARLEQGGGFDCCVCMEKRRLAVILDSCMHTGTSLCVGCACQMSTHFEGEGLFQCPLCRRTVWMVGVEDRKE